MTDGNIFISYRRGPDSNAAGRLHDRLERNFDKGQLFFDVDAIPLGVDFAEYIDAKVGECRVQLVLIGQGWLSMTDRLQNPDDFVRIEIEAALRRPDIPVIPVLLDGADMPTRDTLPESMHALVRRNAIVITHAQFAGIVDGRLTSELEGLMRHDEPQEVVPQPKEQDSTLRQEAELPEPVPKEDLEAKESVEVVQAVEAPSAVKKPSGRDQLEKMEVEHPELSESRSKTLLAFGAMILFVSVVIYQWTNQKSGRDANDKMTGQVVIDQRTNKDAVIIPVPEPIVVNEGQPKLVYFGKGECLEDGTSSHEWHLIDQSSGLACRNACLKDQSCSGVTDAIAKNNSCILHQERLIGKREIDDGSICFIKR